MDDKQRALEAAHILNSPILTEALDAMDAHAYEAWVNAKDVQGRETAWHTQRAAQILRKELFNIIQCAAVKNGGKDEAINAALETAKETVKNGRTRKSKPASK